MTQRILSVLTTAYNREKYLPECIESVLASTFQNYEYIIVDDCSTDRSHEIALAYAKKDSRIRVYRNEKNLGDYPNRNRAAELAGGKYLKYLDADDLIYPERLEAMVKTMERFPEAGFGFAATGQDPDKPSPFQMSSREAYQRQYLRREPVLNRSPLGIIIRTTAFREVGGFSGKRMVGDFELWHILAARYQVVELGVGGTWYRRHEDQESNMIRQFNSVRFEYHLIAYQHLISPFCPLAESERRIAIQRIIRAQFRAIAWGAVRGSVREAWNLFRSSNIPVYLRSRLRQGRDKGLQP